MTSVCTVGRLARAYRETEYEAAEIAVRIDRRPSPAARLLLRRLGTREAGFVTAWNPHSRRHPPGRNRRMQAAFLAATRRLPRLAGEGRGRGWAEEHLLLGAHRALLLTLARRFRQRAIVTLGTGGAVRLVWVGEKPGSRCHDSASQRRHSDECGAARATSARPESVRLMKLLGQTHK